MELVRIRKNIGVKPAENGTRFFNWDVDANYNFPKKTRPGRHSEILEAFNAAKRSSYIIDFNEAGDNIYVKWEKVLPNHPSEIITLYGPTENDLHYPAPSELSKRLMKKCRQIHQEELAKLSSCFQMKTCKESTASNSMLDNCKAPVSDFILKFLIRARGNTLWTPAVKAARLQSFQRSTYCSCSNGRKCNLLHILNNCGFNFKLMTERHNLIVQKLCEGIDLRKDRISVNHENKELVVDEYLQNGGTFKSKIRPDVWFWTQDENITKLWIVKQNSPLIGKWMKNQEWKQTQSKNSKPMFGTTTNP
jgi:hypothetical protein